MDNDELLERIRNRIGDDLLNDSSDSYDAMTAEAMAFEEKIAQKLTNEVGVDSNRAKAIAHKIALCHTQYHRLIFSTPEEGSMERLRIEVTEEIGPDLAHRYINEAAGEITDVLRKLLGLKKGS